MLNFVNLNTFMCDRKGEIISAQFIYEIFFLDTSTEVMPKETKTPLPPPLVS